MYTITPTFFLIRDQARTQDPSLASLFQDSHSLFKMRFQKLANMRNATTDEDSETLRVMLEALIATKRVLQRTAK